MNVASAPFDLQMMRYSSQRQSIRTDFTSAMKGERVFDAMPIFGNS
jgi:hypothetical protein